MLQPIERLGSSFSSPTCTLVCHMLMVVDVVQVLGEDLVLVRGQQARMERGGDTWSNPVSYDKLAVRTHCRRHVPCAIAMCHIDTVCTRLYTYCILRAVVNLLPAGCLLPASMALVC